MRLLADVGATKTLFGIEAEDIVVKTSIVPTKEIANLVQAILSFLNTTEIAPEEIKSVLIAVAAPMGSRKIVLTNGSLEIDQDELEKTFPSSKIQIINDLEALGWYIQERINSCKKTVVFSMGSGFGLCVISKKDDDVSILPTEYGHRTPSFYLDEEIRYIAEGLKKSIDVEFFLSGIGIASQFVIEVMAYVNQIRDTVSREAVTDSLLRTLLSNHSVFTRFVFDINELERVDCLEDSGLKNLSGDDRLLKLEEVYKNLISELVITGGTAGPLLQVLGLNQLKEIAIGIIRDFIERLQEELRNIILTYLPNEDLFVSGSVAKRIDWEEFNIRFEKAVQQEKNKFTRLLEATSVQRIDDELAPLYGLIKFDTKH